MKKIPISKIIQATEQCYDGFFKLKSHTIQYTKFNGDDSKVHKREVLVRNPTAGILLYDKEKHCVLFTEQFRIGALECNDNPWIYELPAGIIESGEAAETAIKREVLEETGYAINSLSFIGEFYLSPGGTSEKSKVFFSEISLVESGVHGELTENEDIRTHIVDFDRALTWIGTETISSSAAIALLWLASQKKDGE